MTAFALDYDLTRVAAFMRGPLPGLALSEGMRAIGLLRGGRLVAGVIFEGYNGCNVWMHVAAEPGARWLNRVYLRACFTYPFVVCGVERVSGYVDASNAASRRFCARLGFREEARLTGAAPDGGDVVIYAMWRPQCRWLGV
jgi:RimJ/RimL family protein N-acetyltransferase